MNISMNSVVRRDLRVLLVEDDQIVNTVISRILQAADFSVEVVEDGYKALHIIETMISGKRELVDIVVLDINLPNVNGFKLLKCLKGSDVTKNIPVIMQTVADSIEDIKSGIEGGAFYYLTKPIKEELLLAVVSSAASKVVQRRGLLLELERHKTSFALVNSAFFSCRTLEEANHLACFIAHCFPNSNNVVKGISELLINAIEHGNLEIGYQEKVTLLKEGIWEKEIKQRLAIPVNMNKVVDVSFQRKVMDNNRVCYQVVIADQGRGFNWRKYIELDPRRALDASGRGIAITKKTSFNNLMYNEAGNKVKAVIYA